MKYLEESVETNIRLIVEDYIKNNKSFSEDLLEYHLEIYYQDNPIPIEDRPSMWLSISNLLDKHFLNHELK